MEHGEATGDRSDVKLGCWKARLVVLIKDLLSAMRRRHITQSSRTMTSHKAAAAAVAAADARARHVSFAFRRMQYERRGGDRVPAYRADFRPVVDERRRLFGDSHHVPHSGAQTSWVAWDWGGGGDMCSARNLDPARYMDITCHRQIMCCPVWRTRACQSTAVAPPAHCSLVSAKTSACS